MCPFCISTLVAVATTTGLGAAATAFLAYLAAPASSVSSAVKRKERSS